MPPSTAPPSVSRPTGLPARLTPNGVSAFVFDRNGAAFDVVRSNDSRKADLSLPEGSYSVVVLNNTLDEYRNIESAGTDRWRPSP